MNTPQDEQEKWEYTWQTVAREQHEMLKRQVEIADKQKTISTWVAIFILGSLVIQTVGLILALCP